MAARLDILLFGASGLSARYGLKYLHKMAKEKNLTWGVAGRNEIKLRNVLNQLEEETGAESIAEIPIVLADMYDSESIQVMTSKTRVLINACGPLRAIGEIVIESCIKTKTHYVDISGEENFLEKVRLEYHEEARKAGIYVVNACGFQCLLYDIGLLYLQKQFPGTLNSVDIFLKTSRDEPIPEGPFYNISTWKSAIDLLINKKELEAIQAKIPPLNTPKLYPSAGLKVMPFRPECEEGWAVVYKTADLGIMQRTQQYLYEQENIRPAQIHSYFILKYLWHLFFFIICGIVFAIMAQFEFGRKLLMEYAYYFSFGWFGNKEPSKEMCEKSWFRFTFLGKGWKDMVVRAGEKCPKKPDHSIMLQFKGKNPAYGVTGLCLAISGIVMATETSKMPENYGVLTPGIAFGYTTIRELMLDNGISIELKEIDI